MILFSRGKGMLFPVIYFGPFLLAFIPVMLLAPIDSWPDPPPLWLTMVAVTFPLFMQGVGAISLWQCGLWMVFGFGERPEGEGWWSAGLVRLFDTHDSLMGGSAFLWAIILTTLPIFVGMISGVISLLG